MPPRSLELFLDTSVLIAAVMSPTGGARLLFHLSEAGAVRIMVGKGVLREAEEVLRRKAPDLMGTFAQLLDTAYIQIGEAPTVKHKKEARALLDYQPDADILAQAMAANPDWLVSHDKEHILGNPKLENLPFRVGTSGDVIDWLRKQAE